MNQNPALWRVCSYSAPGLPKPTNNLIMRELSTRHPEVEPATRDERLLRFARNDWGYFALLAMTEVFGRKKARLKRAF